MALRLRDDIPPPEYAGEFRLPGLTPFMRSAALESLKRDLNRFLRREVRGRSFLISGHRGAGKTSLVMRAIEECRDEAFRKSVLGDQEYEVFAPPPQRPLLVYLHGPSLLDPEIPEIKIPPKVADVVIGVGPLGAKTADDKTPSPTARALSQITVALYRAVARECAWAFTAHAQFDEGRIGGDFTELAGQLALDLDRAPGPATLRAHWSRLGSLKRGLLWPRASRWRQSHDKLGDQGVKEVLAVATAAQAFQVCIGTVDDKEAASRGAAEERTVKSAFGINLADAVNKLIGLSVGVAAAAVTAAQRDIATALAAGLAAGLVSVFSLNLTTERTVKRQNQREYSFIPDRSVETLQRDLPVVIERLREAGLAPIFLIDELDKISDPSKVVGDFIDKLKPLITDNGFYCLISDRDYFNHIQRAISVDPYNKEYSYFSQTLLLIYKPAELADFLKEAIDIVPATPDERPDADDFARSVLILVLIHRSRLSPLQLSREMTKPFDGTGALRGSADDFRDGVAYRLQATIQLAINHVLAGEAIGARFDGEPAFAHLAIDALYYISRRWDEDQPAIAVGPDAVTSYLAERISREKPRDLAAAKTIVADVVGALDFDLILSEAARLDAYLRDFKALDADLRKTWPESDLRTLDVIPLEFAEGLLRADGADAARATFDFDAYGRDLRPKRIAPPAATPDILDVFDKFLAAARVERNDLTRFGLLPDTVVWTTLDAARATLKDQAASQAAKEAAVPSLRAFEFTLSRRGRLIVAVLSLAQKISIDSGAAQNVAASIRPALEAMDRYLDLRARLRRGVGASGVGDWFEGTPALRRPPAAQGDPAARLPHWTRFFEQGWHVGQTDGSDLAPTATRAWDAWRPRLARWKPGEKEEPKTFRYDDVVLAAAGRLPGAAMRSALDLVSILDWSRIALAALGDARAGGSRPPFWAGIAALRALGFGGDVLSDLIQAPPAGLKRDDGASEFASNPAASGPGTIEIAGAGSTLSQETPNLTQPPKIAVTLDQLIAYNDILEWLLDHRAVEAVTQGRS